MKKFLDLDFDTFLYLYKKKVEAERFFDQKLINDLEKLCPQIFLPEAKVFMTDLKMLTMNLEKKYDEKFSEEFSFDLGEQNQVYH